MLKPAFWLLIFLHSTLMVSAQDDEVMSDSLISIVEPAVEEENGMRPFDTIFEQKLVVPRTVPKRMVDSLKSAKEFWYANAAPAKKKKEPAAATGQSLFQKRWFRNLLWVLILGSFIGVLVWYLVSSNLFLFRKRAGTLNREEGEGERPDDIFSIDYNKEISAATASGNFRLAVRLWYLQTLKIVAEKELIDYRDGRTNQDYVLQLRSHAAYGDFFRLTRHFEYTWYGQFPLSAEGYEKMMGDFINFQKGLV